MCFLRPMFATHRPLETKSIEFLPNRSLLLIPTGPPSTQSQDSELVGWAACGLGPDCLHARLRLCAFEASLPEPWPLLVRRCPVEVELLWHLESTSCKHHEM